MLRQLTIIFILFFCSALQAQNPPSMLGFESSEHKTCGDQVNLKGIGAAGTKLKLNDNLLLTYGEIVTLAGDFYGVPERPISLGESRDERRQRFLEAYDSLALKSKKSEVEQILAVVEDENMQIKTGLEKGENPEDVFARMAKDHNDAWSQIMGTRYAQLMARNFDHYGKEAWLAYSTGHLIALETAAHAIYANNPRKELARAYALNAFACHFLSDLFAAGHMRTPRLALSNNVKPSLLGSVLASYMHKEDNSKGLWVSNGRHEVWQAYGDGYYFVPSNQTRNKRNVEILQEAMQASADEVFNAFERGYLPVKDRVSVLMPNLDKLISERKSTEGEDKANHPALFYWNEQDKTLQRRESLDSLASYEWISKWNPWMTLFELEHHKPANNFDR